MADACKIDTTKNAEKIVDALPKNVRKEYIDAVENLKAEGINLGYPYSSAIKGQAKTSLRELRFSADGENWRFLYKFHPGRNPVILHGGVKLKGKSQQAAWFAENIPKAEKEYENFMKNEFPKLYPNHSKTHDTAEGKRQYKEKSLSEIRKEQKAQRKKQNRSTFSR